jgi:tetrahydromethanopterin S-methyltransferase subunit F
MVEARGTRPRLSAGARREVCAVWGAMIEPLSWLTSLRVGWSRRRQGVAIWNDGAEQLQRARRYDVVLRTVRRAEALNRRGASEAASLLYLELGRALGAPMEEGAEEASARPPGDRLARARTGVAEWLKEQLTEENARVEAGLARAKVAGAALAFVVAAVVVVVVVVAAVRGPSDVGAGAEWAASSRSKKAKKSGVLPAHGFFFSPPPYFFFTKREESPSLSIDLGRERIVSAIELRNRLDGQQQRARDVSIELSRDGQTFRRVARHPSGDDAFNLWRASFRARSARYVRLLGTPNEPMHLADVQILGQ